ncbi:MAG TPA: helix-turn-helix transcriptional regulator [Chloroflexia bacterium]|nr:helix-turn-helix transcriptional regulator [Chloroflexia bacterium]
MARLTSPHSALRTPHSALKMSLSDYIKYLRAKHGGDTPWEIAEASGVPAGAIHLIEVKHRRVGEEDEQLKKLASFFNVPIEELTSRREAYRKRLTFFLEELGGSDTPICLKLESGEELEGVLLWYARESLALTPANDPSGEPYIVQRGWIADWRKAANPRWEVLSS